MRAAEMLRQQPWESDEKFAARLQTAQATIDRNEARLQESKARYAQLDNEIFVALKKAGSQK